MIQRPGSGKLRLKLLRDVILTILIAVALILVITVNFTSGLMQSLSQSHIQKTTDYAVTEFETLSQPIEDNLRVIKNWCATGLININKPAELNRLLIPMLRAMPRVSALIIIAPNNTEYFLMRDGLNWITYITKTGNSSGQTIQTVWSDELSLIERRTIDTIVKPTSRTWYHVVKDSIPENQIYWTQPFYFEIQQKLGIAAAVKSALNQTSEDSYVIALDLLITEFYKLVTDLKPSDNGQTFLFLPNGHMFDLMNPDLNNSKNNRSTKVFLPLQDLPESVAAQAISNWLKQYHNQPVQIEFEWYGETWLAGFRRLNPDGGRVWMGTVIPVSDLIGQLYDNRFLVVIAVIIVFFASVILVAYFTRKYIRKIRQLPATRIDYRNVAEDIQTIISAGENKQVEFKSTMRMNLKSGKTGKEIEQAWLKTVTAFLNTEGGILLIGISDSGEVLGLDADSFDNDDKCRLHFKNLIKQHIGLEFSDYIHMDVYTFQGKKLALVEVSQSPNPAFLHMQNDEDFYIRSGPSSVKLPVSKALSFIEQRSAIKNPD